MGNGAKIKCHFGINTQKVNRFIHVRRLRENKVWIRCEVYFDYFWFYVYVLLLKTPKKVCKQCIKVNDIVLVLECERWIRAKVPWQQSRRIWVRFHLQQIHQSHQRLMSRLLAPAMCWVDVKIYHQVNRQHHRNNKQLSFQTMMILLFHPVKLCSRVVTSPNEVRSFDHNCQIHHRRRRLTSIVCWVAAEFRSHLAPRNRATHWIVTTWNLLFVCDASSNPIPNTRKIFKRFFPVWPKQWRTTPRWLKCSADAW